MKVLWRATKARGGNFGRGSCWAATKRDGEAYLDNPGFGGSVLYRAEVEDEYALNLNVRDPWRALARALWEDDDYRAHVESRHGVEDVGELVDHLASSRGYVYESWENDGDVRRALERLYDWVVYEDDFPAQGITWRYFGKGKVDAEAVDERAW